MESAITALAGSSSQVKVLVDDVSRSSASQATGIEQMRKAMQEIERVTQDAAATAEGSAAAGEQLSAQAEETLAALVQLERMLGVTAQPKQGSRAAKALMAEVVTRRAA